VSPVYGNPTRTHFKKNKAKRSGQAKRSGEGRFGGLPPPTAIEFARAPKKAKSSAAARPSAVEKGGLGVSPVYCNPTRTHAEKGQAERRSQAERSGKGKFGGLSRLRHNTTPQRVEESQAERSGRAGRIGEGGLGSPPPRLRKPNSHARRRKQRPGRARQKKRVRVSPLNTAI